MVQGIIYYPRNTVQMLGPTKIDKKNPFLNPLLPQISKANFTKLIYTSLQNSLQVINNITINITDIDWSFIKVPTINQNLLTHKQMHRCITTFIQWLLFDSTIILNYSFVSRARSG